MSVSFICSFMSMFYSHFSGVTIPSIQNAAWFNGKSTCSAGKVDFTYMPDLT